LGEQRILQKNFRIPWSQPNITEDEVQVALNTLRSGWPSRGAVTEDFEALISEYLSSNVVVVNSGSSALMCALIAHGIRPKDRVVVPAYTFVASASIPKILGAELIVADVDRETFNVSPEAVEDLVKKNGVKAVIVVDVAGLPVDIEAFIELSKRYHFILIEDAAEALGAEYKHRKVGSFDHTTIFSFQTAKQITTVEGGCIVTSDKNVAERCRQISNYGRSKKARYVHEILGLNLRITDLQSAIGIIQFKKLEDHIRRRNEIAGEYRRKIQRLEYQRIPSYVTRHSYLMFTAITQNNAMRDRWVRELTARGVEARTTWTPIHMQPCFPELGILNLPNAEYIFDRAITLPIYNSMTYEDAAMVIEAAGAVSDKG